MTIAVKRGDVDRPHLSQALRQGRKLNNELLAKRSFLRRLAGLGGLATQPLLTACGGGSGDALPSQAPQQAPTDGNPQPTAPLSVAGTVSVGALTGASIDRTFSGLSYEKSNLYRKVFTADNAALIAVFRLLGPSVLRVGGNSCDGIRWSPQGAGATKDQVAPLTVLRSRVRRSAQMAYSSRAPLTR